MLTGSEVLGRATTLRSYWRMRDNKFREWYEQVRMIDTLAQKNMESFVSNDPRAAFNLLSNVLNQKIPHRIPPNKLSEFEIGAAADLSLLFDTIWENISYSYRQRGRVFLKDIIDYLLLTGWHAVFAAPSEDGSEFIAEVWNPVTVYPAWSSILSQCAHIFSPGAEAVEYMAFSNGWKLSSTPTDNTVIYDYWWVEFSLLGIEIHNSIIVDTNQVKPDTHEQQFKRIPVFVAPVGGLPDTGDLITGRRGSKMQEWRAETGQSFLATNENVYKAVNKWWSFMMQIVRDTAQSRTYEKSASSEKIVKPEQWNTRGAHFKLGLQDEIGSIPPPSIPVEVRSMQLDLEAMEQRGGPSWTMLGAVESRMSAYAMSQVASTTNMVTRAYHQGIIDLITDIDNFFLDLIREKKLRPYGISLPKGLPKKAKLTAEYEVRIPGDFIQRATTARMLNGNFQLSDERIMEELFPEIKNPSEELGRVRASMARRHPIYAQLSLIEALKQDIEMFANAGDVASAELFGKAVARLEQEIFSSPQQPAQSQTEVIRPRPEVLSPQETAQLPSEEA